MNNNAGSYDRENVMPSTQEAVDTSRTDVVAAHRSEQENTSGEGPGGRVDNRGSVCDCSSRRNSS